jgi:phytoene synthase
MILAQLDRRHPIPRAAMREFCAGMRSDLACERYPDEAAVDQYCYRVAGTVGVVMTSLLGTRDLAKAEPAAAALGMAMQRTNILRDIDEDLDNGRIYLAQETLARCGDTLEPGCREELLRDQIARADALYDEGLAGVHLLRHGRRAVAAAAHMYREILRQIEREGYGVIPGRAVVPQRRKLFIAAQHAALSR